MKCKICGAHLKKDGDICKNCYNEYTEYKKIASIDENELLKIERKFSVGFNLCKSGEIVLLLLICAVGAYNYYNKLVATLIAIACATLFVGWILFSIKRSKGTNVTFYETKLRYVSKYLFIDKEEIILYSDLEDVVDFKSFSQKLFNVGDIRFYTKGFFSGLTVNDVPNIKENMEKIIGIINNFKNKK